MCIRDRTIPIIPAIKPFAKLSQLTVVPKTFHCDIPEELAQEVLKLSLIHISRRLDKSTDTPPLAYVVESLTRRSRILNLVQPSA